jgi:hydroxymethylglutaryl-CoA lyase
MAERLTICEMGPRDGLQNEAALVSVADRVRLIDLLSATGLSYIEAASFVSPKWVPQMAGASDVLASIRRAGGVTYAALAPNLRGYEDAKAANANEIAIFASASEGFSQKNINCSVAESLARYGDVCAAARDDGIPLRGYVSCVVRCPYDGPIAPSHVADVAARLLHMGCREVSLGDTIGAGDPASITAMLQAVLAEAPAGRLAGHYHDTSGRALDCIRASLDLGLRVFDASVAGAGGCPFASGAKGNVDTRAVVALAGDLGFTTGVNPAALARAEDFMRTLIGRRA